jgi:hypothetical protein
MVKNKRLKTSLQSTTLNVKQLPCFKKLALKEKTQQKFSDLRSLIYKIILTMGVLNKFAQRFLIIIFVSFIG